MKRLWLLPICVAMPACSPSFHGIDEHVNQLLLEGTGDVQGEVSPRPIEDWADVDASETVMTTKRPSTFNPPAESLTWRSSRASETEEVLARLTALEKDKSDATVLTLDDALAWAFENGREYRYAEEEFVLACLRLVLELHLWTPQITDSIALQYEHADDDNDFLQSAQAVVNTLGATQRLPWGGEVTATYVATFAREVLGSTSDAGEVENTRIGQFTIGASIPLLRGAGMIAQEDLIQDERNLVYAARGFQEFRRDFWFRIVSNWLGLLVQRQQLDNAIESTKLLNQLAERRRALYEAGRARLYDAAEAENRALQERSRVAGLWESWRLAVDRFKLLINWPVSETVDISPEVFAIEPPITDLDGSVEIAMMQRLDLQTERDRLVDDQRGVHNALNGLLPDLDLAGDIRFGANDTYYYDTMLPSLEDLDAQASLTLSLPLDRESERIAVRTAQITLERARREYRKKRDETTIEVRASVRDIDANLFSLDIQRRNVDIARLNIESIDADPDTYTVLDQLSSIQSLQQALNGRAQAFRRVQESILQYLMSTGQLRIGQNAAMIPIPGMVITTTDSLSYPTPTSASASQPLP